MKLATAKVGGTRIPVIEQDGRWVPIDAPAGTGLRTLIRDRVPIAARSGPALEPDVSLGPPLEPGKIVAIGLNYRDHVRETGLDLPERPLVFTKFNSSLIGDREAIEFDRAVTERVDWEVELVVVIGEKMRNVARTRALDHVFGYTIANDVSARDVQFDDGQWVRGKSLDTFCPLGPFILTADEIPDPHDLQLATRVNAETVQRSTTREMIFDIPTLLEFCSSSFTLEAGDIVLTGTPWGCGEWLSPRRSLHDGDVMETEIDRLGTLTNPVREVSAD